MKFLTIASLLILSAPAFASDEFDQVDQQALAEVQALLDNPQAHRLPVDGLAEKKAALKKLNDLSKQNPEISKEINQISSSLFTDMEKKTNGGEAEMHKALIEAQQDPNKFFQSLPPEQQKRIRELANEIDKDDEAPTNKK